MFGKVKRIDESVMEKRIKSIMKHLNPDKKEIKPEADQPAQFFEAVGGEESSSESESSDFEIPLLNPFALPAIEFLPFSLTK